MSVSRMGQMSLVRVEPESSGPPYSSSERMTEAELRQLAFSRLECPTAEKMGWPVFILHGGSSTSGRREPNRFATALAICPRTGLALGGFMPPAESIVDEMHH